MKGEYLSNKMVAPRNDNFLSGVSQYENPYQTTMKKLHLLFLALMVHLSITLNAQLPNGSLAPDFVTTDVNGNTHHLYEYLDNGQTVILHVFATWSSADWNYWTSGELQAFQEFYGAGANGSTMLLSVEGDPTTTNEDLLGLGSWSTGNFLETATFPVIDDSYIATLYGVAYFPTVFIICPNHYILSSDLISPPADVLYEYSLSCGSMQDYNDAYLWSIDFNNQCDDLSLDIQVYNNGMNPLENVNYTAIVNGVTSEHTIAGPIAPFMSIIETVPVDLILGINNVEISLADDDYVFNNYLSDSYTYEAPFSSTSHVRLDITTDEYPSDITWNITDASNTIIASGGPYYNAYSNYIEDIFLDGLGCYSFNLFDSSDNGIDTEEHIYVTSVDDWGNSDFFEYDGTYEYGELNVPFEVLEIVPVSISGYVFSDDNGNGIMDLNEPGIGMVEVHLGELVTFTNDNGGYAFNDVTADQTSVLSIVYDNTTWPIATTPTSYDLSAGAGSTYNFGLNDGAPFYDVEVWNYLSEFFVCNSENGLFFDAVNFSNQPVNITLTATIDPLLGFISSWPEPSSVVGNTITWSLSNVAPGAMEYLSIYVTTPGEEYIGTLISMSSSFTVTDLFGNVVESGDYSATVPFFCGFDPNEMIVNPKGDTEQHLIENGTQMEYIIHFQNIGNYPVQDVILQNQLSSYLDYSTIEITGASHAGQFNFNTTTGMLEYVFHDIYLPDAENNEPQSHGFLRYRIDLLPELSDGTIITNSALIFFDENAPIYTNEVFNTIGIASSTNDISQGVINVFPNPASDLINADLRACNGQCQIRIFDATGKLVLSTTLNGGSIHPLDISFLTSGSYQLEVTDAQQKSSRHKLMIK